MTKPTKTQLIKIRNESYREQPVECCGTCRYFRHMFTRETVGMCDAVMFKNCSTPINVVYLGVCDLYKQQKNSDP